MRMPRGPLWRFNASRASCQRSKLMMIGPLPITDSSSASVRQVSWAICPSLIRAIQTILERCLADAAIGVEEPLAGVAFAQIDIDQRLHRIDDLFGREGRADDLADVGVLGGRAAQGHLIEFLAVL